MREVLRLENVSKTYQAKNGEIDAIKNVNFTVNEGEFVGVIGPSRMWKIYIALNNCWIRN